MNTKRVEKRLERKNDALMERSGNFENPFEKKGKYSKYSRVPIYLLTFVMIAPYYWMITSSFKSVKELQKVPPTLIPDKWISGNYYDTKYDPNMFQQDVLQGLFQRFTKVKFGFGRFFLNSIFITTTITILTLLLGSLAAFVVA